MDSSVKEDLRSRILANERVVSTCYLALRLRQVAYSLGRSVPDDSSRAIDTRVGEALASCLGEHAAAVHSLLAARARQGDGWLSFVAEGACSECGRLFATEELSRVHSADDLPACPSCSRLLFIAGNPSAVRGAGDVL